MSDIITITKDGPLIIATNYWQSEIERLGLTYLSINARAFRLLLPRSLESAIADMATGKIAVVSAPRNPGKYALEILLDDGSDSPYCVHLSDQQIDRRLPPEDAGRDDLEFTLWTQPRRDAPHQAFRRPAAYRSVPRLPWLQPWKAK